MVCRFMRCSYTYFDDGKHVFIFMVSFYRNVLLDTTEMAVGLTWAAVYPVIAMVWLMSVKTRQGSAW